MCSKIAPCAWKIHNTAILIVLLSRKNVVLIFWFNALSQSNRHSWVKLLCPVDISEANHPKLLSGKLCRAHEEVLDCRAKSESHLQSDPNTCRMCVFLRVIINICTSIYSCRKGRCSSRSCAHWSLWLKTANFLNSATLSFTTRLNGGNVISSSAQPVNAFTTLFSCQYTASA